MAGYISTVFGWTMDIVLKDLLRDSINALEGEECPSVISMTDHPWGHSGYIRTYNYLNVKAYVVMG
jgi:hypothetical protein